MPAEMRSLRFAGDPTLEACLSGEATLESGTTGGPVARVQQALMDLGHVLCEFGPDGVFGPETAKAVAAFNAANGLHPGPPVVGADTMAALDDRFAGEPEQAQPDWAPTATALHLDADAGAVARRAVDIALALAEAGSHYLIGAAGARPGGNEGTVLRPASVTLAPSRTEPSDPAVFAAWSEVAGGTVCAGRFDARNGGMAGGRPAQYTDTDYIVYLASMAAQPEERWKPFFQFYSPRRVGDRLLWGEDCRGQQHFDGAGLVNWCLEQASGSAHPVSLDMVSWAADRAGTHAIALDDRPRRGDVVLRNVDGRFTHIGLLVGNGDAAGGRVDWGHVVLAEQPSVGVVKRRFSPSGWAVRRRLGPMA